MPPGRDLHSALEVPAAGTGQRLFGWYRRGRRVALDTAKALNYLREWGCIIVRLNAGRGRLQISGSGRRHYHPWPPWLLRGPRLMCARLAGKLGCPS